MGRGWSGRKKEVGFSHGWSGSNTEKGAEGSDAKENSTKKIFLMFEGGRGHQKGKNGLMMAAVHSEWLREGDEACKQEVGRGGGLSFSWIFWEQCQACRLVSLKVGRAIMDPPKSFIHNVSEVREVTVD